MAGCGDSGWGASPPWTPPGLQLSGGVPFNVNTACGRVFNALSGWTKPVDKKASSLRLNIEIGTPLFIELQGVQGKLKSKLIGMEPWEYLIIQAPVGTAAIREHMVKGGRVVVRYVHEDGIYAFEAYVQGSMERPARLLLIDYPQKVVNKSLRKQDRYDCYLPCYVEMDRASGEGAIVDISEAGCRCIVPGVAEHGEHRPPAEGSEIRISLRGPEPESTAGDRSAEQVVAQAEQAAPVVLKGIIVNTTEYHSAARVGVQFTDLDEAGLHRIRKVIAGL